MSINELFGTTTATSLTANARTLPGTMELTDVATKFAHAIIHTMEADIENYRDRLQASTTDSNELQNIIEELMPEYNGEADFLKDLSDETVDSLLKSQQSKRSRAKSKAMTLDNYSVMMTAAIAEKLIRDVTGRTRSAGNYGRQSGTVDYTIEQLEALGADQEALRREIRNIQSKKSIMKSKAGFDESDERWLALLKAEQQLKDLRQTAAPITVEVDTTKNALAEMLDGVDITKMKSADAHEMLEAIREMVQQ